MRRDWEAPEGNACIGYSLTAEGERSTAVDVGAGDWIECWPVLLAAVA